MHYLSLHEGLKRVQLENEMAESKRFESHGSEYRQILRTRKVAEREFNRSHHLYWYLTLFLIGMAGLFVGPYFGLTGDGWIIFVAGAFFIVIGEVSKRIIVASHVRKHHISIQRHKPN